MYKLFMKNIKKYLINIIYQMNNYMSNNYDLNYHLK